MIIADLPNNEYHARPEISNSNLGLIAKSPAHFKYGRSNINPDTARIGTIAHSHILEGGSGLIEAPDRKRASAADREWWREWFFEHNADIDTSKPAATWLPEFENQTGLAVVQYSEIEMCKRIVDSVHSNSEAQRILSAGVPETTIIQNYNGINTRVRPDWMDTDRHLIGDVKSTASAEEHLFRKSAASFRYHVQQAYYSQNYYQEFGVWPEFEFIVIEKTPPYSCVVYVLDEEASGNGQWLMDRDIETYKRCMAFDEWPGLPNNKALSIPIYEPETFDIEMGGKMVRLA